MSLSALETTVNTAFDAREGISTSTKGEVREAVDHALELRHDDLQAANTKSAPDAVSPVPLDGVQVRGERLQATLKPASWNVIRLRTP